MAQYRNNFFPAVKCSTLFEPYALRRLQIYIFRLGLYRAWPNFSSVLFQTKSLKPNDQNYSVIYANWLPVIVVIDWRQTSSGNTRVAFINSTVVAAAEASSRCSRMRAEKQTTVSVVCYSQSYRLSGRWTVLYYYNADRIELYTRGQRILHLLTNFQTEIY